MVPMQPRDQSEEAADEGQDESGAVRREIRGDQEQEIKRVLHRQRLQ